MFRRTDAQSTFGSLNVLLSPKKIAKIEKRRWAGGFRRKALPLLVANEETFRPLFCEHNGRPNKPVAATLGVTILKEMFDLTDEAALDDFEFNNARPFALNVEPEEANLCRKTLHHFRAKMSEAEEEGTLTYSALFDAIVRAIIKGKGLEQGLFLCSVWEYENPWSFYGRHGGLLHNSVLCSIEAPATERPGHGWATPPPPRHVSTLPLPRHFRAGA